MELLVDHLFYVFCVIGCVLLQAGPKIFKDISNGSHWIRNMDCGSEDCCADLSACSPCKWTDDDENCRDRERSCNYIAGRDRHPVPETIWREEMSVNATGVNIYLLFYFYFYLHVLLHSFTVHKCNSFRSYSIRVLLRGDIMDIIVVWVVGDNP